MALNLPKPFAKDVVLSTQRIGLILNETPGVHGVVQLLEENGCCSFHNAYGPPGSNVELWLALYRIRSALRRCTNQVDHAHCEYSNHPQRMDSAL